MLLISASSAQAVRGHLSSASKIGVPAAAGRTPNAVHRSMQRLCVDPSLRPEVRADDVTAEGPIVL